MSRPRTALAALVLCAASLTALTACSSSPTSTGSSTGSGPAASASQAPAASSNVARPTNMCALLSTKEASAAFGTQIATTYKGESSCDYSGGDEAFDLTLAPTEIGGFANEVKLLQLDIGATKPISGVGDEAAGNAKGIAFRVGSVIMDMQVSIGTTRTTEAMLTAAAKTVIGHLG